MTHLTDRLLLQKAGSWQETFCNERETSQELLKPGVMMWSNDCIIFPQCALLTAKAMLLQFEYKTGASLLDFLLCDIISFRFCSGDTSEVILTLQN